MCTAHHPGKVLDSEFGVVRLQIKDKHPSKYGKLMPY